MDNFSYTITPQTIILFINGQHFSVDRRGEKDLADKIYQAIKTSDLKAIKTLLAPGKYIVEEYAGGLFFVDSDGLVFTKKDKDTPLPVTLAKRLIEFAKEDLPVEPLLNFWSNLKLNPSKESIKDLFTCLEVNHHPITPDGCFLAYKKVKSLPNGELVDSHTSTICNNVGMVVEMPRDKVNADRNQTCSAGLHVASFEYAANFSGNVLVVVKVDPRHVVSVPIDYKAQKMRTCQYTVLSLCKQGEIKKQTVTEKQTIKANAETTIDLRGKTAKEIIAKVREYQKYFIPVITESVLKNKAGIIKKAETILTNKGIIVLTK